MTALLPADKRCRRCDQTKPAHAFSRHEGKRDGLQSWCRFCVNERSREIRRGRGQHPAKRRVCVRPGWARCAMCGNDFPESEFRRDGKGKPYSYCRPCHNAYLAEINRTRRKDPAYRAMLRRGDRRRRAAKKRENAVERETRLARSRLLIDRLRADGWTLRSIAAESGIARSTLQHIRAGHVPFPDTYERLSRFERDRRAS
jgi:hypothetical protein